MPAISSGPVENTDISRG